MRTLLLSDVHLDPARPAATARLERLLRQRAGHVTALYVLGDLFEYWLGDDQDVAALAPVLDALAGLARASDVFLMHGNRDFLLGEAFATAHGCRLLPDPSIVDLHGTRTLLMHGDTLCTDDVEYQALRRMLRAPAWQAEFLARPMHEREALARQARETSREATAVKSAEIMDVNSAAVAGAFRTHDVRRLIHGHTHRPGVHRLALDGAQCSRMVLGDWYAGGSYIECDADGARLYLLEEAGDGAVLAGSG